MTAKRMLVVPREVYDELSEIEVELARVKAGVTALPLNLGPLVAYVVADIRPRAMSASERLTSLLNGLTIEGSE